MPGRFLAPDRVGPDLTNPQSLNRYSYVLNNPLRYTDPTGNRPWDGEPEDDGGAGGGGGDDGGGDDTGGGGDGSGGAPDDNSDAGISYASYDEPSASSYAMDGGIFASSMAGGATAGYPGPSLASPEDVGGPSLYFSPDATAYLAGDRHSASSIGQPSLDPEASRTIVEGLNRPSVVVENAVFLAELWDGTIGGPRNSDLLVSAIESASALRGAEAGWAAVAMAGVDIAAEGVKIVGPGLADLLRSWGK